MSAGTTLWVSRKAALAKLAEYVFGGMGDDDLERAINYRLQDTPMRVRVAGEGEDDEDLAQA